MVLVFWEPVDAIDSLKESPSNSFTISSTHLEIREQSLQDGFILLWLSRMFLPLERRNPTSCAMSQCRAPVPLISRPWTPSIMLVFLLLRKRGAEMTKPEDGILRWMKLDSFISISMGRSTKPIGECQISVLVSKQWSIGTLPWIMPSNWHSSRAMIFMWRLQKEESWLNGKLMMEKSGISTKSSTRYPDRCWHMIQQIVPTQEMNLWDLILKKMQNNAKEFENVDSTIKVSLKWSFQGMLPKSSSRKRHQSQMEDSAWTWALFWST